MQGGVSISKISKSFGKTEVLSQIDLLIKPGEFLSILGPSGCGKSTLLRIIAGLERPDVGDIRIADELVTHTPVWKRHIGMVFQSFALWPHLSVLRNVSMGLELRGINREQRRERAMNALKMVQLEGLADRMPAQLSGGQQQRVAMARAIVLEPSVLLLDEPLSALDKNLRQDLQVELKTLQQKLKLTTIFVTHDQEEAMSLSDRIVVMNKGVIEQIGTPEQIYNQPASQYVARFVGETTFFSGKIEKKNHVMFINTSDIGPIQLVKPTFTINHNLEYQAFARPGWIQLSKSISGQASAPVGLIERVMFFGSTRDYLVRFGSSIIRVTAAEEEQQYQVGEKVGLVFSARLLPRN